MTKNPTNTTIRIKKKNKTDLKENNFNIKSTKGHGKTIIRDLFSKLKMPNGTYRKWEKHVPFADKRRTTNAL